MQVGDIQESTSSVKLISSAFIVFRFFEKRQNRIEIPAFVTEEIPRIVIAAIASYVDRCIDGAAATEHFSPGPKRAPAVALLETSGREARILLGNILVCDLAEKKLGEFARIVDVGVSVRRPGFQQSDGGIWVL